MGLCARIFSAELLLSPLSPSLCWCIVLFCLRGHSDHEVTVWLWGGLICWEQALVGMGTSIDTLNEVIFLFLPLPHCGKGTDQRRKRKES